MAKRTRRNRPRRRVSAEEARFGTIAMALAQLVMEAVTDGMPRVATVHGDTGDGKTYAVQQFFDRLATERTGYWTPGLVPEWPPPSVAYVRASRKTVIPQPPDNASGMPPFLWIGVECGKGMQVASFIHQLRSQLQTAISYFDAVRARREFITKAALNILGQIVPAVSMLKDGIEVLIAGAGTRRDRDTWFAELARQVRSSISLYARALKLMGIAPTPLVIVVDDAAAVDPNLLHIISVAIGLDMTGDVDDRADETARLTSVPDLPVVVVFTASNYSDANRALPFNRWLDGYEATGLNITSLAARDFSLKQGRNLVALWDHGPQAPVRDKILDHVVHLEDEVHDITINPLVLVEHIAWVESQRDPASGDLDVDEWQIDALSTSPEQANVDRLEKIRTRENGARAVHAVRLAGAVSQLLPPEFIAELLSEEVGSAVMNAVVDLLHEEGALITSDTYSRAPDLTDIDQILFVEPDLAVYLATSQELSTAARAKLLIAITTTATKWIDRQRDHFCGRERWRQTRVAMQSLADFAVTLTEWPEASIRALAGPSGDDLDAPSAVLRWVCDTRSEPPEFSALIDGCRHFGASRVTVEALGALTMSIVDVPEPDKRLSELVDALQNLRGHADGLRASCLLLIASGDLDRCEELVRANPDTAMAGRSVLRVANAIAQWGDPKRAERLLDEFSVYQDLQVLNTRARIIGRTDPERALELIRQQPQAEWQEARLVITLLEKAGRDEEARDLAGRWAVSVEHAARVYASYLLAENDIAGARQALLPHMRAAAPAAAMFAQIAWQSGDVVEALGALAPFLGRSHWAGDTLAHILNETAERNYRFISRPGGRIEFSSSDSGPTAVRISSRRSRKKTVRLDAEGDATAHVTPQRRDDLEEKVRLDINTLTLDELLEKYRDAGASNGRIASALATTAARAGAHLHAISLLRPFAYHVGSACRLADFTFREYGAEGLPEMVALLQRFDSSIPAVTGRLLAISAAHGDQWPVYFDLFSQLGRDKLNFALVGAVRLIEASPMREWSMWRRLVREVGMEAVRPVIRRTVLLASGWRMLPVARGSLADDDTRGIDAVVGAVIDDWYMASDLRELVPAFEGTLYAYARDPANVDPTLYPYQVVSLFESLRSLGRGTASLEADLARILRRELSKDEPEDRMSSFAHWAEFSALAALVLDGSPQ